MRVRWRLALIVLATLAVGAAWTRAGAQIPAPPPMPGPVSASPESLPVVALVTVDEAVARALAASPIVASGRGTVRTARSLERVAVGAYLPSLSATTAATRTDTPADQLAAAGSGTSPGVQTSRTANVSAVLDLWTGGRRRANSALARADLRAADATLISARYDVALAARQAFYEVLRASDVVQVASAQVARAEQLLRYTQARSRTGTVTRSDLLRAQLALTTARQQLLAATDTLRSSSYVLGSLVGIDGPVGAAPDSALAPRPLALDDSAVLHLAVDGSPGVVAAEATADAGNAGVRSARTQYVPTIGVTTGYNWAASTGATTGTRPGWTVSIGTTYPLFNGFAREDAVVRAEVSADVARVAAADARRSARVRAAELLGGLRLAEQSIVLGAEAVRSAREDLRVQLERYDAGVSTILDVLISRAAALQAELALVSARYQYQVARAALEALLGRRL
jgi:outer membrane protein